MDVDSYILKLSNFIIIIFGCAGSRLLCADFLWLWRAGAAL